jgi:hypothetical protein
MIAPESRNGRHSLVSSAGVSGPRT